MVDTPIPHGCGAGQLGGRNLSLARLQDFYASVDGSCNYPRGLVLGRRLVDDPGGLVQGPVLQPLGCNRQRLLHWNLARSDHTISGCYRGSWGWAAWVVHAPVTPPANTSLLLHSGYSTRRIAAELKKAGVIRNELAFRIWHWAHPKPSLKAGEFGLRRAATLPQVYGRIARGIFTFMW